MTDKSRKENQISRRRILPLFGSIMLLPLLGASQQNRSAFLNSDENENYQTFLKSDGTIVKVKESAVKKSKIVSRRFSNSSLLKWLNKK